MPPKIEKGFREVLAHLKPDRAYLVYSGEERYPMGNGVEAINGRDLAEELAAL